MNKLQLLFKDLRLLVKLLVNVDITPTQEEIMKDILFERNRRVIILAMTRYGKTFIVSLSALLYASFNDGKTIAIVSPQYEQSSIVMKYIASFIVKHKFFHQLIDINVTGVDRLKKEVSKKRITFKNGSEIIILSAKGDAERLMGFGADLVIEDESALISDEVFRRRISRMLGDHSDNSILVEIGNAFPNNHFQEHWLSPFYKKYRIDWRLALKEGRTTKEFIEEQRRNLTEAEFKMLYDAEFVEEINNSLLTFSQISGAINKDVELPEDAWFSCGVDVARFGSDLSVITVVKTDGYSYKVVEIKSFKQNTITSLAGAVQDLNKKYKFQSVVVDDIGLGGGLTDILNENGLPVIPFKAGDKAKDYKRFKNLKTELAWKLRILFAEGRISIPPHEVLISELRKWVLDYTSDGRLHLKDPEDKSPDFADSLLLSTYDSGLIISKTTVFK